MDRIVFAGIKIDNLSFRETVEKIKQLIIQGIPSYVVTPNADHVVKLQHDKYFKEIYKNAALVLADGMPILWASKLIGVPLREKISGSDILPKLCKIAAKKGWKVFFMGGREGAADKATEVLKNKYPDLKVVGVCCPPFGFEKDLDENKKIIEKIRSVAPDILFVGVGAPKQEKWIFKNKDKYRVPVSIGVGASFEFVAGMVKRAPVFMQKLGLEWFWRLIMEPSRLWRRYLFGNAIFLWLVLKMLISPECNSNKYEE